MMQRNRHFWSILCLLTLVFWGPFFVASWLYHHKNYWVKPTVNHGALLQPSIDFIQLLIHSDNQTTFRGKWQLLYISTPHCDMTCQNNLIKMQQVKRALGKDSERIGRLLWLTYGDQAKHLKTIEHGTVKRVQLATLLAPYQTQLKLKNIDIDNGAFYVVDPLGNLMMAYPANVIPRDLYDDLVRLLKVSHIG